MTAPLHLFEGVGVELEYMVVSRATLDVRPIVDELLEAEGGEIAAEIERGPIAWSNELALHVIELKTNGPATGLSGLAERFQANVRRINALLEPRDAQLMPTAMHPWMDPARELRLWPHEHNAVYDGLNRIFDCSGHGWANLQAVHLNLPFADDEEFGRLHAAIRLLLPILPALAASSPIVDGTVTGLLDTRMEVYRTNALRIPSVTGLVIPEPVYTRAAYERDILQRIYDDLAPHDPERILRYEWINARGAIARFDRNTIEIRVIDVQETPQADLAIVAAVIAVAKALVAEERSPYSCQRGCTADGLAAVLRATIADADAAVVADASYLEALGLDGAIPRTARRIWRELLETQAGDPALSEVAAPVDVILAEGCLSRRILERLDRDTTRSGLARVYGELCDCLGSGRQFRNALVGS